MSLSSKKVLVAEGDEIILALLSHILTRQGYLVDVATTTEEARDRLKADQYDAVLLSADMPGSGMDWLRQVTDHRVVILSGKPLNGDLPAAGAVIRKPIEFSSLLETVARCLTKSD